MAVKQISRLLQRAAPAASRVLADSRHREALHTHLLPLGKTVASERATTHSRRKQ